MKMNQICTRMSKVAARCEHPRTWILVWALAVLSLVLLAVSQEASASPMADLTAHQSAQQAGEYNNLANLISDMLDDAGNLHKKSKMNSMRQIKQTLRFGRRSDPLMAPGFDGERLEVNANANDHEQRRLLALDMD